MIEPKTIQIERFIYWAFAFYVPIMGQNITAVTNSMYRSKTKKEENGFSKKAATKSEYVR